MKTIRLQTVIEAPIDRVFDLARSIDLHKQSTRGTHEQAIAGRTSGLIEMGESVTWRARHLGVYQNLTVVVTRFERPFLFADKMVKGAFAAMEHIHCFEALDENKTLMIDVFSFRVPWGIVGRLAENLFLESYMKRFLLKKNHDLKQVAEGERWRGVLTQPFP